MPLSVKKVKLTKLIQKLFKTRGTNCTKIREIIRKLCNYATLDTYNLLVGAERSEAKRAPCDNLLIVIRISYNLKNIPK
jgi:hypothetical protein